MELLPLGSVVGPHPVREGVVQAGRIDFAAGQAIVPPDAVGIAFDDLQEGLENGLLQASPGGAAIGIGGADRLTVRTRTAARRVGQECERACKSRVATYNLKKKT